MTLKDAYTFVKTRRFIAKPNVRFVAALLEFERKIYGSNSIAGEEINPIYKFFYRKDW